MFNVFQEDMKTYFLYLANKPLFQTNVDKDALWNLYLSSFPEGGNPQYKERTAHDCQCCRQFIRNIGGIVAVSDGVRLSIWDCDTIEPYATVAKAMAEFVNRHAITNQYVNDNKNVGTYENFQNDGENQVLSWKHFHLELPKALVKKDPGPYLSIARANYDVLYRGLTTISKDALETVKDLIAQNSLYRGEEHKKNISEYLVLKIKFQKLFTHSRRKQINWVWEQSVNNTHISRLRNTAMGTLLNDLSEGTDLERAVKAYEVMVAPSNYKRPTALITPKMIQDAQKAVIDLGLGNCLERRYAKIDDITINNIIWGNRDTKKSLNVFDELVKSTKKTKQNFDHIEEIDITSFIENVVPTAEKLEVFVYNRHQENLVSLIAPVDSDPASVATNMLKWKNNFSWSYNGDITDSMKELVKQFGGSITGILRFSIRWNDTLDNNIDFDAHCHEPGIHGEHIYFPLQGVVQRSSGVLDVDIVNPAGKVAVENITYSDIKRMPVGTYRFLVNNYSNQLSNGGFSAEIEFDDSIHSFTYEKNLRGKDNIKVATVSLDAQGNFEIKPDLGSSAVGKEIWGIHTEDFQEVSMVMNSPNYWDGNATGNRHWFLMLEGCCNPNSTRGFYNEFLNERLAPHRKVFEVLSSKMKVKPSQNQLSGLGFSSTKRDNFICRVTGSFNRTVKVLI